MKLTSIADAATFAEWKATIRTIASEAVIKMWGGSIGQYRPEAHYMRGPGPKWREKHAIEGLQAGRIPAPLTLDEKWDL